MTTSTEPRRRGRFGPPYGYFRHEVLNHIRALNGLSPLPAPDAPEVIRDAECEKLSGLGRVARWKAERDGRFPKRVRLLASPVTQHRIKETA